MEGHIYLVENTINGKKYIGQTVYSLQRRWAEHVKDSRNIDRPLYRAIRAYGPEAFTISLIESCSIEELSEREKYWISYYDTYYGDGYNATLGGEGKATVDQNAVISSYHTTQNASETARQLEIDPKTVSKILKSKGISMLGREQVSKNIFAKKIVAYTLDGTFVKEFESQRDAGFWLIEQGKTIQKDTRKLSYMVSRAARNINNRTQAYGYQWKYE